MTKLCKLPITRHGGRVTYLLYIAEFATRAIWFVEWNHFFVDLMLNIDGIADDKHRTTFYLIENLSNIEP